MATILVIDEYDGFREAVQFGLTRFGHRAHCAQDMVEAERTAGAEEVDLVLFDLGVSVAAGLAACGELRGWPALAEKPIVAMYAYHSPGITERAQGAGAVAVIGKPFDWADLLALIDRWAPAPEAK